VRARAIASGSRAVSEVWSSGPRSGCRSRRRREVVADQLLDCSVGGLGSLLGLAPGHTGARAGLLGRAIEAFWNAIKIVVIRFA
jgi:hypothetical protein